jgi:hypothetical protein
MVERIVWMVWLCLLEDQTYSLCKIATPKIWSVRADGLHVLTTPPVKSVTLPLILNFNNNENNNKKA